MYSHEVQLLLLTSSYIPFLLATSPLFLAPSSSICGSKDSERFSGLGLPTIHGQKSQISW